MTVYRFRKEETQLFKCLILAFVDCHSIRQSYWSYFQREVDAGPLWVHFFSLPLSLLPSSIHPTPPYLLFFFFTTISPLLSLFHPPPSTSHLLPPLLFPSLSPSSLFHSASPSHSQIFPIFASLPHLPPPLISFLFPFNAPHIRSLNPLIPSPFSL